MSKAEYDAMRADNNRLQPQLRGGKRPTDSCKWVSESLDKVYRFNNLAVDSDTEEVIVEFRMKGSYWEYLKENAIPQQGSKGMPNVKYHYEGLEVNGPFKNYGIPQEELEFFNKNILDIFLIK